MMDELGLTPSQEKQVRAVVAAIAEANHISEDEVIHALQKALTSPVEPLHVTGP